MGFCQGQPWPWAPGADMACAQASDGELLRAHTEAHVRSVSGSARGGDRVVGDNFFSEGTPLACRLAAGCTVQARAPALHAAPPPRNRSCRVAHRASRA